MNKNRKPIKIDHNRWYYSKEVYINVCSGYYELIGPNGYIRSFTDINTAIDGAIFQARFNQ
nr:MAG TPA: hypothetical protein [Caudoviricetes sp.]